MTTETTAPKARPRPAATTSRWQQVLVRLNHCAATGDRQWWLWQVHLSGLDAVGPEFGAARDSELGPRAWDLVSQHGYSSERALTEVGACRAWHQ